MAWFFGDGFDLYQQISDAYMAGSYWDTTASAGHVLSASGRFSGSRGLINTNGGGVFATTNATLIKSSGSNDAVHHINFAFYQSQALSGTTPNFWISLVDNTTVQCTIVVRSDGAILLTSGNANGATLATYSGAVAATNTWYSFECEVVINNTTGSFKVRKNGNTSDDSSTTGLNTRPGTNAYANKLCVGNDDGSAASYIVDDLLWRSDTSSVSWAGDVRCNTRLPASDAAVQFTRSGSVVPVTPYAQGTTATTFGASGRFMPFTATCSGTVGSVIWNIAAGFTGNAKCSIFTDNAGSPGTPIGSATPISNPTAGNNTFTFSSPPSVVQGTKYWMGHVADAASGTNGWYVTASNSAGAYNSSAVIWSSVNYSTFPPTNPGVSTGAQCLIFTVNITPTTATNANLVADPAQDGAGGYVYDATSGDQDLYTLQAISGTPSSIVGVTTRMLAQKSDAGTRSVAAQLKSGSTTSNGTSTALNTSFAWISRTDVTDPNTGSAWTATGVNNLTVGPKVTA